MIVILNGPINSGKSTIARILQNKIPNTAHVEVDKLRQFIKWMPGDEAFPLSIENAALVTRNLAKKGLNVIFTYILTKEEYESVIDKLKDLNTKIFTFTFSPDMNVTLRNRGTRELTEKEQKRIKYHYNIGIHNPSFGVIINNTSQKPEETVEVILEHIKKR